MNRKPNVCVLDRHRCWIWTWSLHKVSILVLLLSLLFRLIKPLFFSWLLLASYLTVKFKFFTSFLPYYDDEPSTTRTKCHWYTYKNCSSNCRFQEGSVEDAEVKWWGPLCDLQDCNASLQSCKALEVSLLKCSCWLVVWTSCTWRCVFVFEWSSVCSRWWIVMLIITWIQ